MSLLQPASARLTLLLKQRRWPEEKLPIGLESIRNFNVRAKVVGPSVRHVPLRIRPTCLFIFI